MEAKLGANLGPISDIKLVSLPDAKGCTIVCATFWHKIRY